MTEGKLRIIILTHGGAERFLELVSELQNVDVVGIFIETAIEKIRTPIEKLKRSLRYDGYVATVKKLIPHLPLHRGNNTRGSSSMEQARMELMKRAEDLHIPVTMVANYHSEESLDQLRRSDADLGVLYGTNIVKESIFSIPRLGSINLHQGLAPLYRGGPTVFWELYNGENEVGITVHFVAGAVDTGDIILQDTVPLSYDFGRYGLNIDDFLTDFRASLIEPSAQVLTEAIRQISEGKHERRKQDTTVGKRYKLPVKNEKNMLLRMLKERHKA